MYFKKKVTQAIIMFLTVLVIAALFIAIDISILTAVGNWILVQFGINYCLTKKMTLAIWFVCTSLFGGVRVNYQKKN